MGVEVCNVITNPHTNPFRNQTRFSEPVKNANNAISCYSRSNCNSCTQHTALNYIAYSDSQIEDVSFSCSSTNSKRFCIVGVVSKFRPLSRFLDLPPGAEEPHPSLRSLSSAQGHLS